MTRSIALNFILFQAGWFACVLGGAYGHELTGSLVALIIIAVHCYRATDTTSELQLLTLALVIGMAFESIFTAQGLARYSHGQLFNNMAPHWMILLWPLFATTLNLSMRWLKNLKPLLIAMAGAISAPLAYYAGSRLGAVEYSDPLLSLALIAVAWAVLLPLLVTLSLKFNGYQSPTAKTVSQEITQNV